MLRPTPKSALFTFASLVRCNVVLREGSTPCAMVLQSRCEVIFGYHMDLTNGYLGNQKLEYPKFPIQSYGPLNLLLRGPGMLYFAKVLHLVPWFCSPVVK